MTVQTPVLLLMKGPPGSGKSAIARELGRRFGWPVIDKDDVRDLLPDEIGSVSYEAMLAIARRQLLMGMSVIADSPLGYERGYRAALRIAKEATAVVAVIECVCSDEIEWRHRIEARRSMGLASHHTTDWQRVHDFFARTAAEPFVVNVPHLTVDTASADLATTTDVVLDWVRRVTHLADPYAPLKDNAWREAACGCARSPWPRRPRGRDRVRGAAATRGRHSSRHQLDRYGLDIAPELVGLARRRLPGLSDRLWVGNALDWTPPHRFTYVRTGLEYVPRHRRREVERLLGWCERLIIGVFNEEAHARPTEELLRTWGYRVAGRSERANRRKPGMDYRVFWIESQ